MEGVVTTSRRARPDEIARAKELSGRIEWPFVPREGAVDSLLEGGSATSDTSRGSAGSSETTEARPVGVLVVTARRLELHTGGGLLFYHPGMAHPRLQRIRRGGRDPLVDAMELEPGSAVLDCTLGLAADALVASYVTGEGGRVVGWESVPVVAAVVEDGLRRYEEEREEVTRAMRRIDVRVGDYRRLFSETPDRAFDVVYFDPMFRRPVHRSTALYPLRAVADLRPLTEDAVREARRVARRRVVLKERRGSSTFTELGFVERRDQGSGRVAYGVIEVDRGL